MAEPLERSARWRFQEALDELRLLRVRLREAESLKNRTRAEISEIRDEWDAIHYRWWIAVLIFSGHTAIPFLFALFFETRLQKTIMLAGSATMAISVLLTRNHYTVDVISAYFMGFAIFVLSRWLYFQFVRPLFLAVPIPIRSED